MEIDLAPCPYCGSTPDQWVEDAQTWIKCRAPGCSDGAGKGNPGVVVMDPDKAAAYWNNFQQRMKAKYDSR